METTIKTISRRSTAKKQPKSEKPSFVPKNKYMEAALKYQGKYKLVVNDPNFMI